MMKNILTGLFLTLIITAAAVAQANNAALTTLTVVNAEGKTFVFNKADLAKLVRHQAKGTDDSGVEIQFEGVAVADVLKLAGVKLGENSMRGKRLAEYLLVEAADNYRTMFSLTEFDPDFTDVVIFLADKADGRPIKEYPGENYGNWLTVVPNQKKHGRWAREVVKLTVKTAEPTISFTKGDAGDEEAIYEVLFRALLSNWLKADVKMQDSFYLRVIDKKDPSDALMKRLSDLGTRVRRGSESFISEPEGSIVLDKKTKRRGAMFEIYKLTWISKDEARVVAGDYEGNMSAGSCTYTLRRGSSVGGDGKWHIEGTTSCVIS